ncbi:MAG: DUF1569 domain-containing protein [Saprospiraceae bacterium]
MQNLFTSTGTQTTIGRINQLTPETQAQWGKMNVAQMLAHLNVAYDMSLTNQYTKPGSFKKFMLKMFVKNAVVGPKPYPKNGRTAPEFVIDDQRDFITEKKKLVDYINQVQKLGGEHFNGKESHSFGPLTENEWNTLFSKHLDHHLTQFGV